LTLSEDTYNPETSQGEQKGKRLLEEIEEGFNGKTDNEEEKW